MGNGKDELYRCLSILDSKCSALLQLSSVIIALNTLSFAGKSGEGVEVVLTVVVTASFLAASLLSLFVIRVEWEPSIKTLRHRTAAYRTALVFTTFGLLTMSILVVVTVGLA